MARLLTIATSAARPLTGTSDIVDVESAAGLAVTLDVTAASGTTPTLTVVIEDAPTPSGPWTTLATFAQKTAAGIEVQRITNTAIHRHVRARWTIGGVTPSFTFSLQSTVR